MITIIKFINGVELIGKVVDETAKAILIKDPIQINYKNLENSIPSVSLTRFVQFSKTKELSFEKKNILCTTEPFEQMSQYYETALNHFEREVDDVIKRELTRVVASETDANEMYSAILERLSAGKMLN